MRSLAIVLAVAATLVLVSTAEAGRRCGRRSRCGGCVTSSCASGYCGADTSCGPAGCTTAGVTYGAPAYAVTGYGYPSQAYRTSGQPVVRSTNPGYSYTGHQTVPVQGR